MILPWKNYLETNEVSFQLTETIKYIAYPNGNKYILKQETDKPDVIFKEYTDWEHEKQWISDNYSDIYGVYEPCPHTEIDSDDEKQCFFGKTEDGLYLDRIQRKEEWMNHSLTYDIMHIPNWGVLHTSDGGKTLWKTEWCDRTDEYYNTMRCDIFPDNPGWKQVDKAEILIELDSILSENIKYGIINESFPLPDKYVDSNNKLSMIGNIIIP